MFWTHEPQAPWQTDEWIEQMRASLRPHQYLRMIENRFVASSESFIDMDWWDACTNGRQVVANASMPVWAAVDASVKRDSTAIAVCTWDRETKRVRWVWHRIFVPSSDNPIDFELMVEGTLLELKGRYSLRSVYYDPYQMAATAQRLQRKGLRMEEFPQTVGNLTAASQNLFELIKSGGISVYPDDDVRLAVSRAVALETTRGWRIAKEKTSHKIDIVVALAMAAYAAVSNGESGFMRMGTYNPYSGDGKVRWKDEHEAAHPRRQSLRDGSVATKSRGNLVRCLRSATSSRLRDCQPDYAGWWSARTHRTRGAGGCDVSSPEAGCRAATSASAISKWSRIRPSSPARSSGTSAARPRCWRDNGDTVAIKYLYLRGRALDRRNGFMRTPSVSVGEVSVARGDLLVENMGVETDG